MQSLPFSQAFKRLLHFVSIPSFLVNSPLRFLKFYGLPLWWIYDLLEIYTWLRCSVWVQFMFFRWLSSILCIIYWTIHTFSTSLRSPLLYSKLFYVFKFISGFSLVCHGPACWARRQYHTVLITENLFVFKYDQPLSTPYTLKRQILYYFLSFSIVPIRWWISLIHPYYLSPHISIYLEHKHLPRTY